MARTVVFVEEADTYRVTDDRMGVLTGKLKRCARTS